MSEPISFNGKQALVVGLGESGFAMARWLHRQGASLRVVDTRDNPPAAEGLRMEVPQAVIECGAQWRAEMCAGIDFVALSPGVDLFDLPPYSCPVYSEIDLFSWGVQSLAAGSKIIAVTGSNGKSTVVALTAHLLLYAGYSAVACGNISPSALDALMQAQDNGQMPQFWVLELSSFQLESTHTLAADAATLLNASPDHLDRHRGDFATYLAAKMRIFNGAGAVVSNRDDQNSSSVQSDRQVEVSFGIGKPPRVSDFGLVDDAIWQGERCLLQIDEIRLQGLHNAINVMAALALCSVFDVRATQVLPDLRNYKGLPHRVEWVRTLDETIYINDSKGTNVGAAMAAISGLRRPAAVILGGDGKGQDFTPLVPVLTEHGRAVALIGRDAGLIEAAIEPCALPCKRCADMPEAVSWLRCQARPGDAVLLSPACASFDMYRNYCARGEAFIEAVEGLSEPESGIVGK